MTAKLEKKIQTNFIFDISSVFIDDDMKFVEISDEQYYYLRSIQNQ